MQDRFVGDIGDFGKYRLLRVLTGIYPEAAPRLSLGVVWYYREEESLQYLKEAEKYRESDTYLFKYLQDLVQGSTVNLKRIAESAILGETNRVKFYDTALPRGMTQRKQWLEDALKHTENACIIFLDPDKGLPPPSKENGISSKYAYLWEVQRFITRKQTVVIYQSFWRREKGDTPETEMRRWHENLSKSLPLSTQPRLLGFKGRAFIILPAAKHAKTIDERLAKMLKGPWGQHFTPGG